MELVYAAHLNQEGGLGFLAGTQARLGTVTRKQAHKPGVQRGRIVGVWNIPGPGAHV
jgi:hypothetical protein